MGKQDMNVLITILCFFVFVLSMLVMKLIRKITILSESIDDLNKVNRLTYNIINIEMEILNLKKQIGGGGSPQPPKGG